MFPDKNTFWMRIAEEALLWNIHVHAVRSEFTVLVVCGPSFHCEGTFREGHGWTCKVAVCREGDDTSSIPDRTAMKRSSNARICTPLYYKWVVPIFRPLIISKPGIDYEALRNALRPYAHDGAITSPILQRGRDATRHEIFGSPEENVWYAEGVVEKMRLLGHTAELVFSTRVVTLQTINTTIVNKEVIRRKNKKGKHPLDGLAKRKEFWKTWKEEHALFLTETLGIKGGPAENKFLTGILTCCNVCQQDYVPDHTGGGSSRQCPHIVRQVHSLLRVHDYGKWQYGQCCFWNFVWKRGHQELDALLEFCQTGASNH